jgi:hypothetical protein
MPLDFNKIERPSISDSVTEPRRIFTALPSKDSKYSYPRDVQSQVWARWHERRGERDLVIKMNTGGGKTVVGLLALKSCLNEKVGPAVYITPDNYLAEQVIGEAQALGIKTARGPEERAFLSGNAILVINVHTLFNGKSRFGVRGSAYRTPIELGAVLIDDAHACMATVAGQFTLNIPGANPAHHQLLKLFEDDLVAQALPTYKDLVEGDRSVVMPVPSWAWAEKQEAVLDILRPLREEDKIKFVWPLVVGSLPICGVAISADAIQIAPPFPAVEMLPSFSQARRRIYLTATLADDSILVTEFDADPDSVRRPVTPDTADDLGDRMIIAPLETFPDVDEETLRAFVVEQAKRRNVVVIVPSWARAAVWEPLAVAVRGADDLETTLAQLRVNPKLGLVVLVNKYDGIDLAGDACHMLVLDGLPEAREPLERLESYALDNSDVTLTRQVQRIEQGMGRGVRANDDYCVVLLLGTRLTARLHTPKARAMFSPATGKQLELSDRIARLLEGQPFSELQGVIQQCLDRDPSWVALSRDALDGLTYDSESEVSAVALAERAAFDLAGRGLFPDAVQRMRDAINATSDSQERGLLKQQAAAYLHFVDRVEAQNMQLSAVRDNSAVVRPVDGVGYKPMREAEEQAHAAGAYLQQRYPSPTDLILGVDSILDLLHPSEDKTTVKPFEQAVADLGRHLGFDTQRPEQEFGNGSDGLWQLGNLKYLVIECKSAATTATIARKDIEQLGQSLDWFAGTYDRTCVPTGVLIHPSRQLDAKATAREGARVMTFSKLAELRTAVSGFARAVASNNNYGDPTAVARRLAAFKLTGAMIAGHWTEAAKPAPR